MREINKIVGFAFAVLSVLLIVHGHVVAGGFTILFGFLIVVVADR